MRIVGCRLPAVRLAERFAVHPLLGTARSQQASKEGTQPKQCMHAPPPPPRQGPVGRDHKRQSEARSAPADKQTDRHRVTGRHFGGLQPCCALLLLRYAPQSGSTVLLLLGLSPLSSIEHYQYSRQTDRDIQSLTAIHFAVRLREHDVRIGPRFVSPTESIASLCHSRQP